MTGRPVRVGLDVGGTKIDAVVVADDGSVIGRFRRASGWGDDEIVANVVAAVDGVVGEAGLERTDVVSVGIGIPGLVDEHDGRVLHAVNLGVESLDLAGHASARLGVAVRVDNDVKAASLGAASLVVPRGSMAYLNLGTGVAAGIVVDGRIWRGAQGTAGEVGHLSVDPRGRLCGCGQFGCIETLCGGGALARAWGRPGSLPVRDILDAAETGDHEALGLRDDLFRGAAAAVRVLILTTDVDRVVIGGGLSALGSRLDDGVRSALRVGVDRSPFLRSLRLDERVELLPAGSPAGAIGAALIGAAAHLATPSKENVPHG